MERCRRSMHIHINETKSREGERKTGKKGESMKLNAEEMELFKSWD